VGVCVTVCVRERELVRVNGHTKMSFSNILAHREKSEGRKCNLPKDRITQILSLGKLHS